MSFLFFVVVAVSTFWNHAAQYPGSSEHPLAGDSGASHEQCRDSFLAGAGERYPVARDAELGRSASGGRGSPYLLSHGGLGDTVHSACQRSGARPQPCRPGDSLGSRRLSWEPGCCFTVASAASSNATRTISASDRAGLASGRTVASFELWAMNQESDLGFSDDNLCSKAYVDVMMKKRRPWNCLKEYSGI